MPNSRGRGRATLAALALLVSLTTSSCQLLRKLGGGGDSLEEANRLNRSAGEDIREIERIVRENKNRETEASRALNAKDYEAAKRVMDDSVGAIDRGLEKARSAADKFERASKMDVDPTIREYLSLRAQSVNKAIDAFGELRGGIIALRDATGSSDKAATETARENIQRSSRNFDRLITESAELERRADEIARRNPDKIKPGK